MKRNVLISILLPTLILAACAPRAMEAPAPMGTMSSDFAVGGAPMQQPAAAPAAPEALAREAASAPQSAERLVIRNADLSIVVDDVPGRVSAIQKMAEAMGGFVVSSNMYETYTNSGKKVPQAQVTVRVPQEKLNQALDQIKAGAVDVQSESQSGQDVTDQYVDLQSRLKAKLAAEEQLTQIMKDARRTEDVLAVYAQLQQIQSDIEVLRGQIKYTEQSAALSAINVTIVAEETVKPIEVGPWKLQGTVNDAVESLIKFWQGFAEFMVRFLIFTLPALITIAIPFVLLFFVIRWIVRKLRKPRKDATPPATTKAK
ncbi:MAG TPA: DUF4349 domain-containing protein [Anaerolineales bacterium]|nr:DUF4349 domain-containing protein [Anaerolineales bacterium]